MNELAFGVFDHIERTRPTCRAEAFWCVEQQQPTMRQPSAGEAFNDHYRYDDVSIVLHPVQRPHPGFWYGAITDQSARHAASHRMHVVTLGPLSLVKRANEVYRENLKDSAHTEFDLNPNILTPRVGTTRHIYIAPNDKEAEQTARSAYQVFYDNIEHLWRQFNTAALAFPPGYEAYREGKAIFVGSAARVRDEIAQCIDETGVDYIVLTFAWGNLTAAQTRRSFDLFATRIMPEFIRQPVAAG
jgi:alkanesulfonate monooxygenase SsuD/methylene tetrahydromethanopterin reductase-like flavin-dependent oxidoreductase (luciferase family)